MTLFSVLETFQKRFVIRVCVYGQWSVGACSEFRSMRVRVQRWRGHCGGTGKSSVEGAHVYVIELI